MKWEQIYESMQSADDAGLLLEHIDNYAKQRGFAHVSYIMRVPLLNGVVKWLSFGSLPQEWVDHYTSNKYAEEDPLIRKALNSIEPLVWSAKLYAEVPQIWTDAQNFGFKVGISQPCWAAQGVFGMLSFIRSDPPLSSGEIATLRRQMQISANLLHLSMYEHLDVPTMNCVSEVNLTAREREILHWASEGKTSEIIGAILNISTRTVNFHISNVLTKLVAVNKVQAVAKARTFGLL
ncbi:LuxR family transcriptional regulator [Ochrobactrum soli]|uniref:LuxR family transcriptional regulator n=1 Tax=Ochrobactrum soli TaxID=2448455 RepID=UPI000EF25AF8|nr:LuxR family transcriptional regulator [[Ochrobactrum] soli]RLL74848.1 LuxR family transcriptional regulator [[Ochrobactrum] soli]